jgi:hypothetical protein
MAKYRSFSFKFKTAGSARFSGRPRGAARTGAAAQPFTASHPDVDSEVHVSTSIFTGLRAGLYAGRRPSTLQAPDGLIPVVWTAPGFDDTYGYRRVLESLLSLSFRTPTYPESCPGLFFRRSPPRLFTAAARTGLRPAPESGSRWDYHHLLRSFTSQFISS